MTPARAGDLTGRDWHLLAIDGMRVASGTTLRLDPDGRVSGRAPCNAWSTQNGGTLPALALRPIRATRMACPRLDEEAAFFDSLSQMTEARVAGAQTLILTGAHGRSLEFVLDRSDPRVACLTCLPKD
jgi:heat shock protein HslJ